MTYAPYVNDSRGNKARIEGRFFEAEHGHPFEWYDRNAIEVHTFAPDYPHRIYVGPGAWDTRCAHILKTVAYVVVDEAPDGSPVVEKWRIKGYRNYTTSPARHR